MGLLGDSWDDPRSMATMQLAAGLLSPGSFGQGLGKGLAGYQGTLMGDQDLKLKKAQVLAQEQEQQMRALQMQRTMQQLQFGQQFLGQGAAPASGPSAASSAMGQGAAMGDTGPTSGNAARMDAAPVVASPQQQSRLASLSQDQVAAGVAAGVIPKEFVELWTNAKFGRALPPGWKQNLDGSKEYVPDPTKGVTMGADGKTVMAMPGASEAQAMLSGATKGGELDATNARTPLNPDQAERFGMTPGSTTADLLSRRAPPTGPSSSVMGGTFSQLAPQMQKSVLADMSKYGPGTVNGQPINAGVPAGMASPPSASAGGFKTAAQMAADTLSATQGVHATTDPIVKFNTDRIEKAHTGVQAVYDKLSDTVRSESELQNRNQQILPLLGKIQTGGFKPEERIAFANALQTSGMVPSALKDKFAEWIAGGDPTSGKVIENQLAAAGIKTMLDTLDKEGKPNMAIFKQVKAAQESASSGNATLKQVFDLQKQLYNWHFQQEQDLSKRMEAPDYNPMSTLREFSASRNASIVPPPATAADSAAQALPANPSSSNLKIGATYTLPNGQSGKWDGFKFKGQ